MGRAKEIIVKVIPSKIANEFVKKHHYSGKVVPNSKLHFGCFLDGKLHGVMQYGSSMDKRKVGAIVDGTGWNEFIELNRMAFDDYLPRNSESYCIGVSIRLIKKYAPQIKWIVSFADGCSCGDGTIYRASNFVLTSIKKNTTIRVDENGNKMADISFSAHRPSDLKEFRAKTKKAEGFQLRYIYFIDKSYKDKLTVPIIPFTKIDEMGAGMYKGENVTREERHNKKTEKNLEK